MEGVGHSDKVRIQLFFPWVLQNKTKKSVGQFLIYIVTGVCQPLQLEQFY